MNPDNDDRDVIDPEVRAYVYSLVSALGGSAGDEGGRYILGDDALACLKDLKRWLKLYDERTNRLDVARCLAEANLVNGDLLEILAAWREDEPLNKLKSKIALACLELLVPLTWPIEKEDGDVTVNHHRHMPYLQLAHVSYKRGILHHDSTKILRTAVRIGLPSMALPLKERSSRDEGIIKLILYFFRNVALISPPRNLPTEETQNDIARSATIDSFEEQDILHLILTVSSSMGDDFDTEDVVVLELLFHLLKGIDVPQLFLDNSELSAKKEDELQDMLNKEAGMRRSYARVAPSRHNRFGTMIWLKRDDEKVSTLSGQDVLRDGQQSLAKMDRSKRSNKSKRGKKGQEPVHNDFSMPENISSASNRRLRAFVEEFLDASFNPLFIHIRKAIEREEDRVLDIHIRQYFYLVGWFLEAQRERRERYRRLMKQGGDVKSPDTESFALVAGVLNQETFISLNRSMQQALDNKSWHDLNAGMKCFTQILLTVHEMSESPLEEDQEIAENIQNRIFYEETTHDRLFAIVRAYKDQGYSFLDTTTELTHVFLRMLERYSKQNVDMQVRSRRRARKKKAANPVAGAEDQQEDGSEAEEVAQAQMVSKERKFDFNRFASKLVTQKCVDLYVALTQYYNDLDTEQLKRLHRFFYRAAFKMEMSVLLFRVDIIALFNKMIMGPDGLDQSSPVFKDWNELVRQIFKKLIRKMQERPELVIEILFSKIPSTLYYLEYGHEKQTVSKPRAPAELEVKPGWDFPQQIGIAVTALLDQDKRNLVQWIKNILSEAATERQSWSDAAQASAGLDGSDNAAEHESNTRETDNAPSIVIKPDNELTRVAMFRDNRLRLLMKLVGFERLGLDDEPDATWVIPSILSAQTLSQNLEYISAAEVEPPQLDGKSAEDCIRRKSAARRRADYDDDDDDAEGDVGADEDFLFPAGGPTIRKSDSLQKLKTRRRRKNKDNDEGDEVDEEAAKARREARRIADLEKRRKIKSELFVHDSDDEDDEDRDREFFALEEKRRQEHARKVHDTLMSIEQPGSNSRKKRKSEGGNISGKKRTKRTATVLENDEEETGVESISSRSSIDRDDIMSDSADPATDTPFSSPHARLADNFQKRHRSESIATVDLDTSEAVVENFGAAEQEDDEDIDEPLVPVAARRRMRAGFIVESDSE
ncbi:putative topoisomerase 1-associated factor 1 [Xylona heveae TC161]|uniref:Topoisomerase 1-associated factor 1 n=1 Tax=Xylona heveae (strain CBS 132557 / TC161) TaxID=1328760 RepID=A0A165GYN7_XYLHT|nr:putative topoisomerase 1-associated factor 1 [Xylona heveae TC161]KZF22769.1 putative topoisomerase 1-associated factor 1 [Xylona heveae TC161]